MATRIVVLTGSELRHQAFRTALALSPDIAVVRSYCEGLENTVVDQVAKADPGQTRLARMHLEARARSESDFFSVLGTLRDDSNPRAIARGAINTPEMVAEIAALAPDVLVAYGCSLIREPLLSLFSRRFLNIHLGLSPYYRGAGTNFWALVNDEPEYVGATFMHIDAGVDTGEIIHQMRARVFPGDTPHQIGNRLIADMIPACAALVRNFDRLAKTAPPPEPAQSRIYRRRDFNDTAVERLYDAFAKGLVDRYLDNYDDRNRAAPIVENAALTGGMRDHEGHNVPLRPTRC